MQRSTRSVMTLLSLVLTAWSPPDATSEDERRSEAEAHFAASAWQEAADSFQTVVDLDVEDHDAWYKLGYSLYRLGECEAALGAYRRALPGQESNPRLFGTSAICAARLGRVGAAIEDLERALDLGAPPRTLLGDAAFADLGDNARFAAIVEREDRRSRPCLYDDRNREFDFWVGEWDVYSGGNLVGRNRITSDLDGCLVFEDYVAGSYIGRSMNFFDPAEGKWRQIWVDGSGTVTMFVGEYKDDAMRFDGLRKVKGGVSQRVRMTFSENGDGSVRQFIESSSDDGATWAVGFDGRYVPRLD